ncbi:MAG: hypothetical protein V7609_2804 [Verrucomicrobiota bacterium]
MSRKLTISLLCWLVVVGQAYSQDVFIPRELKAVAVNPPSVKKEAPAPVVNRAEVVTPSVVKERSVKEPAPITATAKTQKPKTESPAIKAENTSVKEKPADRTKTQTVKAEPEKAKTEKAAAAKDQPTSVAAAKKPAAKPEVATEKTQKPAAPKDEVKVEAVTAKTEKAPSVKDQPASVATAKKPTSKTEPAAKSEKTVAKDESVFVPTTKTANAKSEKPAKEELPTITVAKTQTVKADPPTPKVEKVSKPEVTAAKTKKEEPAPAVIAKTLLIKPEPISALALKEPAVNIPVVSSSLQSAFTKIADGFDFPVGRPEAEGYYKARGYRAHGHMGEDWDGIRGGDTDLKDPIFSIGDGIVVFARDVHLGWGNVIIVRHAYRENGTVKYVDALYGHLHQMLVGRGQRVARGQQIATMGTAHGQYDAHLHLEIRKNLEIGMSKSKFQKDLSNYFVPTDFIASHRHLAGGGANYKVAMNTFTHDWMYHFDKARDFSARKRSTSESSAALKRALTSTTR